MSSIMKGLTNEGENVAVIYIDGKPIAKYTKKHEAEDNAQLIRKKFPNKKIEVKQEVREAEGDTLHDPEYALPEARRITKAIKYDDTVGDIVTQIQMLAERTEGIDSKTLEYSIDRVLSAKNSLESEVYGLEEAFEDAARNAQYKRDDVDEGNYHDNRTGFRRGPRDDERHDLDVQKPSREEWGLKINGKVWSKDGKDVTFASKEQALKARQTLLAKRPELEIGLVTRKVSETLDENLKQWFKEKWVRFGPDGKIRGDCARGDDSEGKPKCLPQSKAQNLGKEGRASAAARKRREDPNPERSGKAINVNTKKKTNEADEWEEDGDKWKRFQKWSIDQMMRSTERTATGNHVSKLENQYFGHPITYDTSAGNVLQQPFGSVSTNVGAGRRWTEWVKSIMDNYEDYEAEWKADSAAALLDNPEYKKFLARAYTDFMGMGENTTDQREQHAMALSGYQVKHFGGKLFGSLFGNIKGARASMTPEVYGALEKAQYDLEQKKITDWDDQRRAEQLKFWQMLPYPIKLMVAAGMGKTPAQVEAILSTSGKSDNEIMGAYFSASEPEKPTKPEEPTKPKTQKESIVPRQPGNKMTIPQKPLMAVSLDRWKQGVLARYPNAIFRQQKMINGATFAIDDNKQVGIYDPKNSYAKVGPESLKTENMSEDQLDEKQDACYRKVKSRYKVWPSAYASGALVQCRKKGASNWGNGGKKNESVSLSESDSSDAVYNAVLNRIMRRHLDVLQEYGPTIVMYAIEDVANGVGDLEEIGSSDVSIWTKQVINDLQSGQYAHLKETPTGLPVEGQPSGRRIYRPKSAGTFAEDTAYAGGMGQGGNAGQSYRKFKPKSAGTFKESAIMAGLKKNDEFLNEGLMQNIGAAALAAALAFGASTKANAEPILVYQDTAGGYHAALSIKDVPNDAVRKLIVDTDDDSVAIFNGNSKIPINLPPNIVNNIKQKAGIGIAQPIAMKGSGKSSSTATQQSKAEPTKVKPETPQTSQAGASFSLKGLKWGMTSQEVDSITGGKGGKLPSSFTIGNDSGWEAVYDNDKLVQVKTYNPSVGAMQAIYKKYGAADTDIKYDKSYGNAEGKTKIAIWNESGVNVTMYFPYQDSLGRWKGINYTGFGDPEFEKQQREKDSQKRQQAEKDL